MRGVTHLGYLGVLAVAILAGGLWATEPARGAEFKFVAQELAGKNAIWVPTLALIETATDLEGGLVLEVENPTNTEHAFAVHGLFEMVPAEEGKEVSESNPASYVLKPIRYLVLPKETKRIRVGTEMLGGHRAAGQRFKVFCPIHSRFHLNGAIWVVG